MSGVESEVKLGRSSGRGMMLLYVTLAWWTLLSTLRKQRKETQECKALFRCVPSVRPAQDT